MLFCKTNLANPIIKFTKKLTCHVHTCVSYVTCLFDLESVVEEDDDFRSSQEICTQVQYTMTRHMYSLNTFVHSKYKSRLLWSFGNLFRSLLKYTTRVVLFPPVVILWETLEINSLSRCGNSLEQIVQVSICILCIS